MWLEEEKLNMEVAGPEGGGHALLMVHGAGGGAALWREVMGRLAPYLRVTALDLSGHGGSPSKAGCDPDVYVNDILAAARALGGAAILCGHSMGGALAMLTALRHPDSVDSLILAATGARLRVLPVIFDQLRSDFAGAVDSMSRFAFAAGASESLARTLAGAMLEAGQETTIRDFTFCDNFDVMKEIGGITQPTLVICGGEDMLTPPKYSAWLHERIGGSRLRVIAGCGHTLMLEAPDEFAGECRRFAIYSRMKT